MMHLMDTPEVANVDDRDERKIGKEAAVSELKPTSPPPWTEETKETTLVEECVHIGFLFFGIGLIGQIAQIKKNLFGEARHWEYPESWLCIVFGLLAVLPFKYGRHCVATAVREAVRLMRQKAAED